MSQALPMITIESHIRGLIFDCDGTLGDSMPLHRQTWAVIFEEMGRTYPREFWGQYNGMPTENIIRLYNEAYDDDLDPIEMSRHKEERVRPLLRAQTKPIQPVVDVVLEYHGRLPMTVASGSCRANVDAVLEALSIADRFHSVWSADDPVAPKPAPDLFLAASESIGVPPAECLVFEDGDAGLQAAAAAGMSAIDIRPIIA